MQESTNDNAVSHNNINSIPTQQNGDLNWIVKGKILAFAGPSYTKNVTPEGYCTLAPSDYIPYFKSKNIGLVVRLNKKNYNEQEFIDAGIDHVEEFYTDGSCPHMSILHRIVASFENQPKEKGFAVHCKAGLGRTGTNIGAYLMKHYRMTAKDVIGWMRICRPGMVIGPQQQFLEKIQLLMWQEGDAMRRRESESQLQLQMKVSMKKQEKQQQHFSSPSSRSMSTTATSPETPDSVVLASVGSQEVGHEVILTGAGTNRYRYEPSNSVEERNGRPGQADGLLAARRGQQHQRQQQQQHTPMSLSTGLTDEDNSDDEKNHSSTQNKASSNQAVPVTPDNRGTSSTSMWARAFE